MENLKLHYMQVDSSQKCMPVGGPIGYDTFVVYTFISLIGYGQNAGFLKTLLRNDDSMLDVDFSVDLGHLGSKGEGLWGHAKCKVYLLVDCLVELAYMLLLVLIAGKVFIHSVARIQTKQMFARQTNANQNLQQRNADRAPQPAG